MDTIKWAFANLLKHPDEFVDGEAIKNQFIKLGSELFGEKRKIKTKRYAAVLYPQSSSEFNKDFADAIAKLLGIPSGLVLQLRKTIFHEENIEDIEDAKLFNLPELEEAGKFLQEKKRERLRGYDKIMDIGDIEVSDARWPKAWVDREVIKLKREMRIDENGNIVIHGTRFKDKRRYVRIFSNNYKDSDGKEGLLSNILKDDDILIIDDNVDSQGTLESMHDILVGVNSVDIYVPLNLKG